MPQDKNQSTALVETRPPLKVTVANPRGFCAGVDRAIQIVELALEKYGAPVYVRHEIVHNRYVVESLEARGAIFVDELDEIPDGVPVVFSAHGVPKSVPEAAQDRGLFYLDATCPLVSKVHREAERHSAAGRHILLIGHAGHPEVIGTMGQLPEGGMTLIETVEDAQSIAVPADRELAYTTQTTLSVDDTADIVAALQARFPAIHGPKKEDICYATTNRQAAVKEIAGESDAVIIIGAPNSSNSLRLVEVAAKMGCDAMLVQRAADLDFERLKACRSVGISAGASAPEVLVREVLEAFSAHFEVEVTEASGTPENIRFKLPSVLAR
jgi:4-hydroxy-3-methylbut-2-enyl diphosphate reductase